MFHTLSIRRIANIEDTQFGQVFVNPSYDQLKGIRERMKRYIDGLKGVSDSARSFFCCFRILRSGNDIYGWLDPPVEMTHSQAAKELNLGDVNLARDGSGIWLSDFDKFGYDIRTLFQKTVGNWGG